MSEKRNQARKHAVQAIYQWQIAGQDIPDIINQFLEEQDLNSFEIPYFQDLMKGVPGHLVELDELLKPTLDRAIESVDPVERAILRLGAYELSHKPEIPYRVVINEAVELAKVFGAEQGHKFVNGVLDQVARKVRAVEVNVGRS
ncbi:MAG: transcription antitermination factor NusB [Candidatus Thiodiazotropha sp. (ex Lucina aurantia)]|uniref:Transcription antitermination protein NusB n=2 Tax=Candidatus Thiodiazotropha TaxID=1913444 RepID=A0A7Z1AG77_9GAMM|nr:transcription antitermination factor NusB [Candidatus Thiodiazotropha endolucinida]MBT3011491.1 transcription antitermination factor NusB [Candidatus Thiodiazotropha sp. (ex Lucina pensylvanica)]MBT3014951.1 transcription antitermination factor NusB [Candidatus Thiodiazotropha taylori]MBT3038448.1 transcription antitermination factor NusB [Candidatus Thiodiazotropha sp. (ex Codakia orbicularis)]MBV2102861.1 transcription antitermination factor NusB [Candidatus Thiodiazotropha sp. (ex Lucina 